MPKATIIYKVWCIISGILCRMNKLTTTAYRYTNKQALKHSPAIQWLFAGLLHK